MSSNCKIINSDIGELAFQQFMDIEFAQHRALRHPMFQLVEELARTHKLTAAQFEFFRHIMFARVYLTIPCILEALKSAVMVYDKESIRTGFQNLNEELSSAENFRTHIELMELAFNCVADRVFGLPSTSLGACFNRPRLPEELLYRYTVQGLYKSAPVCSSLAQELSSGGFNDTESCGMMAQLYGVFFSIFQANKAEISETDFKIKVLPYFTAHLSINSCHEIVLDRFGVEFQHGERAKKNYMQTLNFQDDWLTDRPYILAFLEAQAVLFDSTKKALLRDDCAESTQGEHKRENTIEQLKYRSYFC